MRLTIYEKEGRPCFLYLLDTNLWKNWKRTCSDSTSRVRDWRFPGLSNSLAFSGSSSSARMEMKRLASSFNLWISASTSYNFHDSSWHESRLSKVQKSNPNKKKCIQILIQTLQTQTLALQNSLDMTALTLKRLCMLFLFKKFWKESTFLPEKSRWTPKSKM